ncbi:hypothetical protein ES288_D08G316300v1 [Gossypium darwinii]|uniref:tRNA (adenine(58)-N(1))-methyltransferase catalytic subunit TRM61 C-terminal domain-containing protein n=1 Tax=Gossypium darwinii TaxID=34276 RepID=A0A5D2BV09_GOSDA|nr:hypothetical protein ES288_D08G316300v1 [Gossypium darwinii]
MELCSFSPCIGQVQLHVKLRFDFTDIWTFEMLLHMYEIHEWKIDHLKVNDGNSTTCPPRKRRQPSSEASVGDNASSPSVMAWPSAET